MLEELKSANPQKVKIIKLSSYLLVGVIVFIGLMILLTGVMGSVSAQGAYNSQIAELEAVLAEYDNPENQPEAVPELHNASTFGGSVAEYQSNYWSIREDDERALDANRENVKRYLADTDYLDMSGPWLVIDSEKRDLITRYTWRFCTSYGTFDDELDVFWTCQTDSGMLLGYATGIYHGDTDRFSDIRLVWTWEGQYLQEPYPEPEPEPEVSVEPTEVVIDPDNPDTWATESVPVDEDNATGEDASGDIDAADGQETSDDGLGAG